MLSESITHRAIELIKEKGMDPLEAAKQALIDEINFIGSLIGTGRNFTEKGCLSADYLREKIYGKLII